MKTFRVWQVRRHRNSPLGNVTTRFFDGCTVSFDCVRYRQRGHQQPSLKTFESANSSVAGMVRREDEIGAFNARYGAALDPGALANRFIPS